MLNLERAGFWEGPRAALSMAPSRVVKKPIRARHYLGQRGEGMKKTGGNIYRRFLGPLHIYWMARISRDERYPAACYAWS
jgi:hypothetical protein